MAVSIDGDLNRMVTQMVANIRKAFALADQQRCEGMTQVVETNTAQFGRRKQAIKDLPQIAWANCLPARGAGVVKSHCSMVSLTTVAASRRSAAGFCISFRSASDLFLDRSSCNTSTCSSLKNLFQRYPACYGKAVPR